MMISVEQAYQTLLETFTQIPITTESVPLLSSLSGVLQEEIRAPRPSPPFDKAMMDGIAIKSQALNTGIRNFKVIGIQSAGQPPKKINKTDQALEIATGAILPQGTDVVIPYEELDLISASENKEEIITARIKPSLKKIKKMSHVQIQGKEYQTGDLLMIPGTFLSPKHVSVLASVGKKKIKRTRPPSIGVIITGNELIPIHQKPKPWQIRISNEAMISSFLNAWGLHQVETTWVKDDFSKITQKIDSFIKEKDWILITGSLSKGKFDFVPSVLESLQAKIQFYRVRQKPGKPFLFATRKIRKKTKMIFGLPGNPMSALICLRRYILSSYFESLAVRQQNVDPFFFRFKSQMKEPITFQKNLTYFPLVSLTNWETKKPGNLTPAQHHGSGDFFSLAQSDGFIELPSSLTSTKNKNLWFFPWYPY